MEENLINLETAKLAKEKGFISRDKLVTVNKEYYYLWMCELQKWLRDVHKINLYISYEVIDDSEVAYVWNIIIDIPEGTGRKKDSWDFIKRISSFSEKYMMWYKNYEEALEAGLQEALKLI